MGEANSIKKLAQTIVKRLLKEGFVIQRYDAYSTDSIYLKLDYGVCNSIRISNHDGKKKLKYRYNIGSHIEKKREEQDTYIRYYFNDADVDDMIQQILSDKNLKIEKYGTEYYQNIMWKNKKDKQGNKGFWSNAVLVSG